MSGIKARIERTFEQIGRRLCTHKYKTLFFSILAIGFLTAQIPKIQIDTSPEAMLRKTDPSRILYNEFLEQFGHAGTIVIAIENDHIFEDKFLQKLKAFHGDLETNVPHIKKIHSLVNVRRIRSDTDALIIEKPLEDESTQHPPDLESFRQFVLQHPLYRNNIISEDGKLTAVVLELTAFVSRNPAAGGLLDGFDQTPSNQVKDHDGPDGSRKRISEEESGEAIAAVKEVMARYRDRDFDMILSGLPVIINAFNDCTRRDMLQGCLIAVCGALFLLVLLFRSFSGVLIPVIVTLSAMTSTIGLMAVLDVTIKITTTVVPAVLLSVGVADSIHILVIFLRRFQQGASKQEAIVFALGHSGLAVLMTSLTTVAGLLSFSFARVASISELGIFSAIGVILALIYTIVLLPPLLAIFPISVPPARDKRTLLMDRILIRIADFSTGHPLGITIICLLLLTGASAAMFRLKYSDNIVEHFPDSISIKHDVKFIDQEMKGIVNLEVIVDTGRENGIYDPRLLSVIESVEAELRRYRHPDIFVGSVIAITDILKEIHQVLHDGDPAYRIIPPNRAAIAEEFFLLQNSAPESLDRIVDRPFSKTCITIKTPFVDSVIFDRFTRKIDQMLKAQFGRQATVTLTGLPQIFASNIPPILHSMTDSYLIAFFTISIMMIFMVGSVKVGLISMFPNILPVLLTMGAIGLFDITLDFTSMMIGCIALGLVVDDTVHFMYNFRRYYRRSGDARKAARETLISTGRAMVITSFALSIGFFAFVFGMLGHMQRFGLLLGITILVALLVDFVLAPALMVFITRREEKDL